MPGADRKNGLRHAAYGVAFAAFLAIGPAPAQAISVPITFEFDDGIEGEFGTVEVVEDGSGGLDFEITLGSDLGPDADLHYFYFNLVSDIPDLSISSTDNVVTEYTLESDPSVRGGAGSAFDYAVFFGNGAGRKGNGNLAFASFTLFSGSGAPLSLGDLFEMSSTAQGLEANFALHVQSTDTGANSETVGAVIPEPTTFALFTLGLLGLAFAGRRAV
jgi:hypothetical protein